MLRTDRNGTEKWIYVEKLIADTLLKDKQFKTTILQMF